MDKKQLRDLLGQMISMREDLKKLMASFYTSRHAPSLGAKPTTERDKARHETSPHKRIN
jgi:hypothetical protein